jgi:hypothetical protein
MFVDKENVKFGWATILTLYIRDSHYRQKKTPLMEPAIALTSWLKMNAHFAKSLSHKKILAELYTTIVDNLSLNQEERAEIELAANNESSPITFKPGKNEVIEGLFIACVKHVWQLIRAREKRNQFVNQAAKHNLAMLEYLAIVHDIFTEFF